MGEESGERSFRRCWMSFGTSWAARLPVSCAFRGLVLFLVLALTRTALGYSVLTHEEIVDLLWPDHIKTLLLKRFPGATEEQLREAHAYAYGGSVIQDMGYYPFGSKEFSNLVHYVRSGDFVVALLNDAANINEYAFALGALSHYVADNVGHPTAVNHAVAVAYPKLRAKYGDEVTYGEDPKAHIKTEFGFDVVEVAKHRYPSDAYRNFIGFEVAKPLLQRAFQETYGIDLNDVFGNVDLAIGTYRRSVSKVIPEMTRVALLTKKADIVRDTPNFSEKEFLFRLSKTDYEREWGADYKRPGAGARFMAFLFHLIPKVGPLKAIDFNVPTKATEAHFIKSIEGTTDELQVKVDQLSAGPIHLVNRNCDTGSVTRPGEYKLTDETYAKLLHQLSMSSYVLLTPQLKDNITTFYADLNAPFSTKQSKDQWKKTLQDLDSLKAATASRTALSVSGKSHAINP